MYEKTTDETLCELSVVNKELFIVQGCAVNNFFCVITLTQAGHLIGNHTYSHMQLNQSNSEAFKEELVQTSRLIEELTGQEVQYVRPPYGTWNKKFEKELNMFPVLWTIDPLDWSSSNVSGIVNKVTSKAKDNSIILMHDEYKTTVTAALQIVDKLQEEGYEFVTVEEILFE